MKTSIEKTKLNRFNHLARKIGTNRPKSFTTSDRVNAMLRLTQNDVGSGRYHILLYRFITDNIPVVNACIWTWARLAGAPGKFEIVGDDIKNDKIKRGEKRLERLTGNLYANIAGNPLGISTFLPELFNSLFRDGIFAGFVTVKKDGSGIDRFIPLDAVNLEVNNDEGPPRLYLEGENRRIALNRPDFYCIPLSGGMSHPLGQSILQAVPFVSYIEQQLVDDMRRTTHNAGFHRLHVKITPPERMSGESDQAYYDRINDYFDSTVNMIKSCDIDDNPVTWNNVEIEYIGPDHLRGLTNNWFFNHRAMVEEICAGTNLAPFLLGYSYGSTSTWAGLKFDVIMRQVKSVQAEVGRFMEWLGNIELALAGLDMKCRFVFDNTFAYQAMDRMNIVNSRVDNILKLHQAGLLDESTARQKAGELL